LNFKFNNRLIQSEKVTMINNKDTKEARVVDTSKARWLSEGE
jgi:hypothetical protein